MSAASSSSSHNIPNKMINALVLYALIVWGVQENKKIYVTNKML